MRIVANELRVRLALAALTAVFATALAACNQGQQGFGGSVGNTPNVPPETIFKVLGNVGTPFTLTISNSQASWIIGGVIPLNVTIVNDQPPTRMIATKLANDSTLMSLQIAQGGNIEAVASTSAPFGTASVQTKGSLSTIAPPANPDLRIYVNGPFGERFQALIEDSHIGFVVQERAPAVFLFFAPSGSVDGQFSQLQNLGPFQINMTFNGLVVATATGGPNVTIKQP
jgi:hypothetical protein